MNQAINQPANRSRSEKVTFRMGMYVGCLQEGISITMMARAYSYREQKRLPRLRKLREGIGPSQETMQWSAGRTQS